MPLWQFFGVTFYTVQTLLGFLCTHTKGTTTISLTETQTETEKGGLQFNPRIKHGEGQETETLVNEEAQLLAKFLRNGRET
jgi:hypothetical protein